MIITKESISYFDSLGFELKNVHLSFENHPSIVSASITIDVVIVSRVILESGEDSADCSFMFLAQGDSSMFSNSLHAAVSCPEPSALKSLWCAFHSSIANLYVGFRFYGFTTATAEELPADRSVSSSILREEKYRYPPPPPTEIFLPSAEKIVRRLLCSVLHTVLFIYEAAWCLCVMRFVIARRCSVPLYLTAQ